MSTPLNRTIITGSNERDDSFDANEKAIYFGGGGGDSFSNREVSGQIAEGGSAWFVGGSGNDTYRAALDTVTVVQETGDSNNDQWFDIPGALTSPTFAAEVDGKHLLIGQQDGDTGVLFVNWRDPQNRIENFNLAIPGTGFRELNFSEFENLITNSQNFLGNVPIEATPTLSQSVISDFRAELQEVPDIASRFEREGSIPTPNHEEDNSNVTPNPVGDNARTDSGTDVRIDVLANDTDPDNDTLSIATVGEPLNGTVNATADGGVIYTPDNAFQGVDTFTYTITDGNGNSASAEVSVEVIGGDNGASQDLPPIAANVFVRANQTVNVSDRLEIFGRSGGDEAVEIEASVRGVKLDANLERIDLPKALADYAFEVTDQGLQVFVDDAPVISMPSANQDIDVRFVDGSATLRQTGAATFTLVGEGASDTIDGDRSNPNLPLDGETSATSVAMVGTGNADADALEFG